ncbi:MAG: hypothetical protein U0996_26800 [Planctomycetaceae bacterium]
MLSFLMNAISLLSLPLLGTCIVLAVRIENPGRTGVIGFLIVQVLLAGYGLVAGLIGAGLYSISPALPLLAGIGVQIVRIGGLVLLVWGLHELSKGPSDRQGDSGSDFGNRPGLF